MSNLVSAYVKYKQARAQIKARQRVELERELEPLLKNVGQEILAEQDKGKTIEDIEYSIGAKNRNLVYRAKRLAKSVPSENQTAAFEELKNAQPEYKITTDGVTTEVTVFNIRFHPSEVWVITYDDEGNPLLPDAWSEDPELASYRPTFKKIAAEIIALNE